MAISCLQVHCRRAFVLSAALTLAACSSSSTNNDSAQGGNGDAASAKSGGSTAGVDAAVASTGGSTASSGGSTTSTGGSTVSSGGTTSLGGSTAGVDAAVTSTGGADGGIDSSVTDSGGSTSSSDGSTGGDAASDSSVENTATLFLPDDIDMVVYRYNIAPGVAPVLADTISVHVQPVGAAVRPATGELFVADDQAVATLYRFLSPLGTPATNGTITPALITYAESLTFVDDELWVPSATPGCTTQSEPIVRIAFDAQGNASVAGTVTIGSVGANRGSYWNPATRDLFVTQCQQLKQVQHYQVANDHSVKLLAPITATDMYNPSGVIVAPWGEIFVANAGTASETLHGTAILRFTLDAQGNATENGSITGNQLYTPTSLLFAPWGELIVINNSNQTMSRFTFDASHMASPSGTYKFQGSQSNPTFTGTGWATLVPGTSTVLLTDGGTEDTSRD